MRVGLIGNGRHTEGGGGVCLHRDGEGQRGLVGGHGVHIPVCHRVGVHEGVARPIRGDGGEAGEFAGGRVKGQAGDGRGQGVGEGAVAAGGLRQGQRGNLNARDVGLVENGCAEDRGGVGVVDGNGGEGYRELKNRSRAPL